MKKTNIQGLLKYTTHLIFTDKTTRSTKHSSLIQAKMAYLMEDRFTIKEGFIMDEYQNVLFEIQPKWVDVRSRRPRRKKLSIPKLNVGKTELDDYYYKGTFSELFDFIYAVFSSLNISSYKQLEAMSRHWCTSYGMSPSSAAIFGQVFGVMGYRQILLLGGPETLSNIPYDPNKPKEYSLQVFDFFLEIVNERRRLDAVC